MIVDQTETNWSQVRFFCALACAWLAFNSTAMGQLWQGPTNSSGSSSRELRQAATNAIPLEQITPEAQRKINGVLENTALYRQLPVTSIETDPDLFILLARYPEIVVETWSLMGVSQMSCQRTGPYTLKSDDGAGTISEVELVYGTENLHLYYGTGTYSGNLIRKPVDAEVVLLMRTSHSTTPQGMPTGTNTLDVFIRIENAMVGLAAKTLLPLVGRTADHNFVETLRFVERFNDTTEKNGPGVQGMAWRLEGLQPEVRQQLIETAGLVYDRAQLRSGQQLGIDLNQHLPAVLQSSAQNSSGHDPSRR